MKTELCETLVTSIPEVILMVKVSTGAQKVEVLLDLVPIGQQPTNWWDLLLHSSAGGPSK
jgi:hypothetical protein